MAFEIAKSGWVERMSSFLKRWKPCWLVLYHDGFLRYFDSPQSHTAEEAYRLPTECRAIYTAYQVDVNPPAHAGKSCLFSVVMRDGTQVVFCAEGADHVKAWQVALEEARVPPVLTARPPATAPPVGSTVVIAEDAGSSGASGTSVTSVHSTTVVACPVYPPVVRVAPIAPVLAPPARHGQTTMMYTDDPYAIYDQYDAADIHQGARRRRDPDGQMAGGLMAGMAVGSLMWAPMFW